MNLLVFTGTFKQRPNLKNGVAYGTIKTDKMFLNVVAFGDTANEVAKQNDKDLLLIEGKLQQTKYNEKWSMQVVINLIKPISTDDEPIYDDDGRPLNEASEKDDDLPF